jgi:hypothetical protein
MCECGQHGGLTAKSIPMLSNVVAALSEALAQAMAELSPLLHNGDAMTDIRFVPLTNIEGDVPVSNMGRSENYRKLSVESSAIGEAFPAFEIGELGVSGKHHITLSVAINSNGVSGVKVFPRVDKLHGGILVFLSNVTGEPRLWPA